MLILSQTQQFDSQQRAFGQGERLSRVLRSQAHGFRLSPHLRHVGQIDDRDIYRLMGDNGLSRLTASCQESCPQSLMPSHDIIQALLKGSDIERTGNLYDGGNIIDRTARLELIQEPQPLL
jgi:hypothetical protein